LRHFNEQLLASDRRLQQAAASRRLTTNTKAPTADSVSGSVLAGDVHEERLRELAGGVVHRLPSDACRAPSQIQLRVGALRLSIARRAGRTTAAGGAGRAGRRQTHPNQGHLKIVRGGFLKFRATI
jgi:hypothetical protein